METHRLRDSSHRLSAVRRDLENVNDKIDIIDTKLEIINLTRRTNNPKAVDKTMDSRTQKLLELEERNNIHSSKLRRLQTEIDDVQKENDVLMEYIKNKDSPRGTQPQNKSAVNYNRTGDEMMFLRSPASHDEGNYGEEGRYGEFISHSRDRSRHVTPKLTENEDFKREISSPRKSDHGHSEHEKQDENEDPWAKHQAPKDRPDDFDFEEFQRQRRAQIYSYYDQTAINPQRWEKKPKHKKYPWYDHEVRVDTKCLHEVMVDTKCLPEYESANKGPNNLKTVMKYKV